MATGGDEVTYNTTLEGRGHDRLAAPDIQGTRGRQRARPRGPGEQREGVTTHQGETTTQAGRTSALYPHERWFTLTTVDGRLRLTPTTGPHPSARQGGRRYKLKIVDTGHQAESTGAKKATRKPPPPLKHFTELQRGAAVRWRTGPDGRWGHGHTSLQRPQETRILHPRHSTPGDGCRRTLHRKLVKEASGWTVRLVRLGPCNVCGSADHPARWCDYRETFRLCRIKKDFSRRPRTKPPAMLTVDVTRRGTDRCGPTPLLLTTHMRSSHARGCVDSSRVDAAVDCVADCSARHPVTQRLPQPRIAAPPLGQPSH